MNAPGPHGLPLVGNLLAFRRDVLGLLTDGRRQHGDVVRFRLGPLVYHLVAHPDHIRRVLVTHPQKYDKNTPSSSRLRSICGESLLTGNGEFWRRQRRLIQPVFQPQRMAGYHDGMVAATADLIERWHAAARSGSAIDVASEMMRLTFTIVARALFGVDLSGRVAAVERAATVLLAHAYRRLEHLLPIPLWMPTPGNLAFRRQMAALNHLVDEVVEQRRRTPTQSDLLSRLMHTYDDESSESLTNHQLRDETITLLLAGHETTANALTWTWHLLGQQPEAAERVRAEVRSVLGERRPTFDDLAQLNYTRMVLQESMRLYPPIWIMERHAREADEIAGYHIPAGTSVVTSPYVTHRHPEFWPDPDAFAPERFTPEAIAARPQLAYFPFGAGPRHCVGSHFALAESLTIVAMVAQRFRLESVPGVPIVPLPGITLRSRHGLPMILHSLD